MSSMEMELKMKYQFLLNDVRNIKQMEKEKSKKIKRFQKTQKHPNQCDIHSKTILNPFANEMMFAKSHFFSAVIFE